MMKLWRMFGGVAMSVAMVGGGQAQRVCIGDVCSNSGSLPNGTYRSYNGVPQTYPNNLPSDAYYVDPRTGQRTLLNPPPTALPPSYSPLRQQTPSWDARSRGIYNTTPPVVALPNWIELTSRKGTLYCEADILDTSIQRNLRELCGNSPDRDGIRFVKAENPFVHVVEMSKNRSAFCLNARKEKGKGVDIKVDSHILPVGKMPECIIAIFQ